MIQIKMPAVPLAAPPGESSADRIGPHAVRADCAETAEVVRHRIRQQGLSGWDLVCVIDGDGRWAAYGHGLGHGIGLATHEAPSLSRNAPEDPLPSPTVFSVEPGIYLEGETGVRIEDLVHLDAARGIVERLTLFPRDVIVLEG